jgi:hypothetical protein
MPQRGNARGRAPTLGDKVKVQIGAGTVKLEVGFPLLTERLRTPSESGAHRCDQAQLASGPWLHPQFWSSIGPGLHH